MPIRSTRGRLLFLGYGCATCHGLAGQGGSSAPSSTSRSCFLDDFRPLVRSGPGGMPAFTEEVLSDDDLDAIYAFLEAIRQGTSITSDGSTSTP